MKIVLLSIVLLGLASCAVVQPGEVGVKKTFGELSERTYDQGLYFVNPFTSSMERVPTRTVNMEVSLSLPSKEGLNIESNISILYKIEGDNVQEFIQTLGPGYETVISSVFRSTAADVCARYMAKDMHSGKRAEIEQEITTRMNEYLRDKSIIIEAVLMKQIKLPPGLYNSIEGRLEAEQEVMRMQYILKKEELEAERKVIEAQGEVSTMEFVLEKEKLEAQRKVINAEGQRDAQKIITDGLSDDIIRMRSIEAFDNLSKSQNAKVIITNGKTPFLIESK
ncbi:MAG: prohibitin family protein [Candidatus Kapaibacteriales bacterium]